MRTDTPVPSEHQDRLVHTLFGWYALTREQSDLGPFATPDKASLALSQHIKVFRGLNLRRPGSPQKMHLHDADQCPKTNCALCVEARVLRQSFALAVS